MKEKELLKTIDAAKYIGVSQRTLLTYAKEGIIPFQYGPYRGPNKIMLFDKEDLDEAVPKLVPVHDQEEAIKKYKSELVAERDALKKHIKELRREYSATEKMWAKSSYLLKVIESAIFTLSHLGGDVLSNRDISIVMDMIKGMSTDEICRRYKLSRETIRMTTLRVYRLVVEDIPAKIVMRVNSLENDNACLRQSIEKLLGDYERLRVSAIKKRGVTPEVLQGNVYSRPIRDLFLSVRAGNCVRAIGCETIGDLCSFREDELMQIRSFGVNSLENVRGQLAKLGLSLGTAPRQERLSMYYI